MSAHNPRPYVLGFRMTEITNQFLHARAVITVVCRTAKMFLPDEVSRGVAIVPPLEQETGDRTGSTYSLSAYPGFQDHTFTALTNGL